MEEMKKELEKKDMEKVTGGALSNSSEYDDKTALRIIDAMTDTQNLTDHPHCRECREIVLLVSGKYRCFNFRCTQLGKDKAVSEVDWY